MDDNSDIEAKGIKFGLSLLTLIFVSGWLCSGSPDVIDALIFWISGGYYKIK